MNENFRFIDHENNLTVHGFIKNQIYQVIERKTASDNSGRIVVKVNGPGLSKPMPFWETTFNVEFVSVDAVTMQQPVQQPVQQLLTPPNPIPEPTTAPNAMNVTAPGTPKVSAQDIYDLLNNLHIDLKNDLKKLVVLDSTKPSVTKESSARDILLDGLLKLDFGTMNMSLIKSPKVTTLTIIVDGMPPLCVKGADIAAEKIVQAVTDAFTEEALVINSIKEWKLSIKESASKKEEEAKKEMVRTKPPVGKKSKADAVEVSLPLETSPVTESLPDEIFIGNAEPDDMFNGEPETLGPPSGLSSEVEDFQIM